MAEKGKISTIDYEDSVNVDITDINASPSKAKKVDDTASTRFKKELKGPSCPVECVTVYTDRAEVNRVAETTVEAGENEIVITGLPSVIDEDSLRVQCFGEATIIEVAYKEETIKETPQNKPDPEETENETRRLTKEKSEKVKQIEEIKNSIEVLEKEKKFLITYGDRLRPSDKVSEKMADAFDKKSLDSVTSFLDFFHGHCQRLNREIFALKEQSNQLKKDIEVIDGLLAKLPSPEGVEGASYIDRQVSVILEAENQTELRLIVSYVVSNASWTPTYDLRAFSKDSQLQLLYFGNISQNTGEDWIDAKLFLSTAMPNVGGTPPELNTWYIHLISATVPKRGLKKMRSFRKPAARYSGMEDELMCVGLADGFSSAPPARALKNQYFETTVTEGITSTSFEIARESTIKCDDTAHKVSIGQIDLKPEFEYATVPKMVAHAFLKAKVKNTSNFALLAGPANVFLDNNFLAKSALDAVSPMEEFEVSLGVDPAVKVTYKPLKKFKQTTGLVAKYTQTQYVQEIVIKNTKASAVKITVIDALPKSSEEKLKVNLIEPVIPTLKQMKVEKAEEKDQPIKLNDKNNLEWILDIPASETKELSIKYNIEHSINMAVSGV